MRLCEIKFGVSQYGIIIKCGIMSQEDFEDMTVKIAKGEPDAPKIRFEESLQTMARLLSKENMHLLNTYPLLSDG